MMKKKTAAILLIFVILISLAIPACAEPEQNPMELSIEDAVKIGIQNSTSLKQVQNEIELSRLADDRSRFLKSEMDDADKSIRDASNELNSATIYLSNDIMPVDYTIPGTNITIPKGANLNDPMYAASKQTIKDGAGSLIAEKRDELNNGEQALSNALQSAGETLSNKLNIASMESFGVDSTGKLMTTMSDISLTVAKSSYDIYKNQIAMQIKKCYYDVLKAQKMLEAKNKAMERAKKQLEFAQDGFKAGMKAKDDILLAVINYSGTQIEYIKALGDLNNSLVELKKNMNIPMDTSMKLIDVLAEKVEVQNLEEGLISGMKNRLEMKKALGEEAIYTANNDYVRKYYDKITFQYKEAELRKDKAILNFKKTKQEVESSIRQSYETQSTAASMLEKSKEMISKARESLEIAEYKYREGFGSDSSLLKKLDLESSAGTIVEVLAAQENLSQVEEKVIEITYGYNLAKVKYLNDIGKFIY